MDEHLNRSFKQAVSHRRQEIQALIRASDFSQQRLPATNRQQSLVPSIWTTVRRSPARRKISKISNGSCGMLACCHLEGGSVLPWLRRAGGTSRGVRGVRAPRPHIGTPSPSKCLRARRLRSTERTRFSRVQLASVFVHQQPTTTHSSPLGLFHSTVGTEEKRPWPSSSGSSRWMSISTTSW